jgi:hypothetical protein
MEYDEEGVKPLFLYSIIGKTPNGPQAKCSLWDFFSAVFYGVSFTVLGTVRGQLSFYSVRHRSRTIVFLRCQALPVDKYTIYVRVQKTTGKK